MSTRGDGEIDDLAELVIGCAIEVHRNLGPGLLESVYRECLLVELLLAGRDVEVEKLLSIDYKGHHVPRAFKMDLVVEDCLVVELKSVDRIHPVFQAQVISYLKLSGYPAGLLFNFNVAALRQGLRRLDHPDRYRQKRLSRREAEPAPDASCGPVSDGT